MIPKEAKIDRILFSKPGGLYDFMKSAWPIIEGREMIEAPHIKIICEHLEAVTKGDIQKLIINVPPATGKSTIINVLWPAWEWTMEPWSRWMFSSFDDALVLRDARRCRSLINSEWYQERWPHTQIDKTRSAADKAGEYWTTEGGLRYSITIRGKGTGWHCRTQVCDDPHKPSEAFDSAARVFGEVGEWWDTTMSSRGVPGQRMKRLLVMQRIGEGDLTDHCLNKGGYHHLCLPMHYSAGHPYIDPDDHRTEEGELLCPQIKGKEQVDEEAKDLGAFAAAAQHDQLPSPLGGGIIKRGTIGFWTEIPEDALTTMCQSWDFTFGAVGSSSYVAGQVWYKVGGNYYLIDRIREQMTFPEMERSLINLSSVHPKVVTKLIEDKAAGVPIYQALQDKIDGLQLVKVSAASGGKAARLHAVSGLFDAGNVFVPHPSKARLNGKPWICPWSEEWITLVTSFRGRKSDSSDDVDATSQALSYLREAVDEDYSRAMTAWRLENKGF